MNDTRNRKRVVRDDNRFFRKHPDRQYRIRRASPVEIRQTALNGGLPTLPQGWRWFLAILSPAQHRRICLFLPNAENADTNLDEGEARFLFEYVADAVEAANVTRH